MFSWVLLAASWALSLSSLALSSFSLVLSESNLSLSYFKVFSSLVVRSRFGKRLSNFNLWSLSSLLIVLLLPLASVSYLSSPAILWESTPVSFFFSSNWLLVVCSWLRWFCNSMFRPDSARFFSWYSLLSCVTSLSSLRLVVSSSAIFVLAFCSDFLVSPSALPIVIRSCWSL